MCGRLPLEPSETKGSAKVVKGEGCYFLFLIDTTDHLTADARQAIAGLLATGLSQTIKREVYPEGQMDDFEFTLSPNIDTSLTKHMRPCSNNVIDQAQHRVLSAICENLDDYTRSLIEKQIERTQPAV